MRGYGAVRVVAVLLKIIGLVCIVGGFIALVGQAMGRMFPPGAGWLYALAPVIAGLVYLAIGQLLDMFVDIAHDLQAIRAMQSTNVMVVPPEEEQRRAA